jgi:hypothetical protein
MQIPIREGGSWSKPGPVIAYAEVDAEDYAELSQYRWHLNRKGYVMRTHQPPTPASCPECGWTPRPGVHVAHSVASHRGKMHGKPPRPKRYDISMHRRSNLRITPGNIQTQNRSAVKLFKGKPVESAYRGVNMVKHKGKFNGRWKAEVAGKYLGCFDSEVEAAKAASDYRLATMQFATD